MNRDQNETDNEIVFLVKEKVQDEMFLSYYSKLKRQLFM
jgi:hypothetical protein